jgi:tetratricopeptide (TPR) repeat protein
MKAVKALVVIVAGLGVLWSAARADRVVLKDGAKIEGTVKGESADKMDVVILGGEEKSFHTYDVASVVFDAMSPEYSYAKATLEAERNPEYQRAIDSLDKVLGREKPGSRAYEYARWLKAQALVGWAAADPANRDEALGALADIRDTCNDFRFKYLAALELGDRYLDADDFTKAGEVYREVERSRDPVWHLVGKLRVARAAELAGKVKPALEAYREAYLAAGKGSAVQAEAGVMLAGSLIRLDPPEVDDALKVLEGISGWLKDRTLLDDLYLVRGLAHYKKGDYHGALLNLLRVDIAYYDDPETRSEALYWAAECFRKNGMGQRATHIEARSRRLFGEVDRFRWKKRLDADAKKGADGQAEGETMPKDE